MVWNELVSLLHQCSAVTSLFCVCRRRRSLIWCWWRWRGWTPWLGHGATQASAYRRVSWLADRTRDLVISSWLAHYFNITWEHSAYLRFMCHSTAQSWTTAVHVHHAKKIYFTSRSKPALLSVGRVIMSEIKYQFISFVLYIWLKKKTKIHHHVPKHGHKTVFHHSQALFYLLFYGCPGVQFLIFLILCELTEPAFVRFAWTELAGECWSYTHSFVVCLLSLSQTTQFLVHLPSKPQIMARLLFDLKWSTTLWEFFRDTTWKVNWSTAASSQISGNLQIQPMKQRTLCYRQDLSPKRGSGVCHTIL